MSQPTTSLLDQALGVMALLFGGGAGVKIIDVVLSHWRRSRQAERKEPADMTRAAGELMEKLSEGSQDLLTAFRLDFKYLRGRVADLQEELDKAKAANETDHQLHRAEVDSLRADHVACEKKIEVIKAELTLTKADLAAAKAEIDRMLKDGRVAGFDEPVPEELKR